MKIITIHHSDSENEQSNVHSNELKTYIDQHSKHFDEKSLQFALNNMINDDGSEHRFTKEYIEKYIKDNNIHIGNKSNMYDVTYTANMAYADFYPHILQYEESCIKYAIAVANDVDGYEGIQFRRWLADLMSKNIQLY